MIENRNGLVVGCMRDRRPHTRHSGYTLSQRWRKTIEHPFGWLKAVAGVRQVKMKGLRLVDWVFTLGMAAYDLIRMRRLLSCPA